jgi:hypothetical protein
MRQLVLALLGALAVGLWGAAAPLSEPVGRLFPPGTYVLGGGPETATAKHAAAVRARFTLHPNQYVLSGGPAPTDPIVVDDDLEVLRGGAKLFLDDDHVRSTDRRAGVPCTYEGWPVILALEPGAKFRVRATDHGATEAELGDLYLHRWDGAKRQLVKARKERSNPVLPHVFFDQEFAVDEGFAAPAPAGRARKVSPQRLEALWSDLGEPDAAKDYFALWGLAAVPGQAAPFLRDRLRPAAPPDRDEAKRIARLVAQLDSDSFKERQGASAELTRLGERAEPALRDALAASPSVEARRRIEGLLEGRARSAPALGQSRPLRAVEALEHMGAPEARQVLEALGKGAPGARLTQAARAALGRLDRRPALVGAARP